MEELPIGSNVGVVLAAAAYASDANPTKPMDAVIDAVPDRVLREFARRVVELENERLEGAGRLMLMIRRGMK